MSLTVGNRVAAVGIDRKNVGGDETQRGLHGDQLKLAKRTSVLKDDG